MSQMWRDNGEFLSIDLRFFPKSQIQFWGDEHRVNKHAHIVGGLHPAHSMEC